MVARTILLVTIASLATTILAREVRGWNDEIAWTGFETGLEQAKTQKKPIMLVIHKTWCGACKRLKPEFANSREIEALADKFVMINAEDDEEPQGAEYAPDGGYIPRILFMDDKGKVMTDIKNQGGSDQYKYFYSSPAQITQSMQQVLDKMASASAGVKDEI